MHLNSLLSELDKAFAEISLITGLRVDAAFAKEFAKKVSKFVLEHYSMLTVRELVFAFDLNAVGELNDQEAKPVSFYGQILTIDILGKVLFRYIQKRAELARKLNEQRQEAKELPPPSPEQQEMDDKLFCNEYYRKYLNQEFSPVSQEYAHMVYNILDRLKEIPYTAEEKKVFMAGAQVIRDKEIAAPTVDRSERAEQNRLVEGYLNGEVPVAEHQLVINYAKRLALLDLFKTWKDQKRIKIFEI